MFRSPVGDGTRRGSVAGYGGSRAEGRGHGVPEGDGTRRGSVAGYAGGRAGAGGMAYLRVTARVGAVWWAMLGAGLRGARGAWRTCSGGLGQA